MAIAVRGFNLNIQGCQNCEINGIASINTLCGTSFGFYGCSSTIENSLFRDNGESGTSGLFSDGLTLARGDGIKVLNNTFSNNSDVDLILGQNDDPSDVAALVQGNKIIQPGPNFVFVAILAFN